MKCSTILFLLILIVPACSRDKLSRDEAANKIQKAGLVRGQSLVLVPARAGCAVVVSKMNLGPQGEFFRHPAISLDDVTRGQAEEAYARGLLDITIDEQPLLSDTVFSECADERQRSLGDLFVRYGAPNMKLVRWSIKPNARALEAGFPPQPGTAAEVIGRAEFVRISGLTELDAATTAAEYEWKVVPTELGRKIGFAGSAVRTERAVFKKYDDGWRLQ